MDNKSLYLMMENAKGMMIASFNQIEKQTKLPAYLMEGIALELLSEIRSRKNLELISELKRTEKSESNAK